MKLKKCILSGVLAASMLCESLFGVTLINPVQVYADEPSIDNTGEAGYTNVAKDKAVKTSSVDKDSGEGIVGGNAVDGDEATKWVSVELSNESPQWLQIDLGKNNTAVERIEIQFDEAAWTQTYDVETYDSEKNAQRHTVKTVGANGPTSNMDDGGGRNDLVDTIKYNNDNEKIVLRRYVNFSFNGSGANKVSVAEIRIYGKDIQSVHGPSITMVAPVEGEYPEPAKVYAPAQDEGVYHHDLADRTTPAATLWKQAQTEGETENRVVGENDTSVSAPIWRTGEPIEELTGDQIFVKDGTYGFNAKVQTPGTNNKFDVWGSDIKIVSFQLYLKSRPASGGTADLFGKSDKFAVQLKNDKLLTYMQASNSWPEQAIVFGQGGIPAFDQLVGKWHDVLIVVDGKGKQRIYLDGKAGQKTQGDDNDAIPVEVPNPKGLQPFTFGFNYANHQKESSFADRLNTINSRAFTTDYGYLARFKFYSNKNYAELKNGAGTDLTDAAVLSSAFDEFSIATLETGRTKDEVYNIITNMLQKENPTARVSLCPYSRATVWSKKEGTNWVDVLATEKFAGASTKYKATTRLIADDGFMFDESCLETVLQNLDAGDENAKSTVKISNKERELTIVTYYNCEASDVEDTCHIDNILVENDPIEMTVGDSDVAIGAEVTGVGKCGNHSDAEVEVTYTLPEGEERVTLAGDKLTAVKTTKGMMGHDPVQLVVTATLKKDGKPVQAGGADVKISRTVEVQVDPVKEADQVIEVAPVITAQAPVAGKYPQVVDIAIPATAKHFEDIADRMNPVATLEPLTEDYINNSIYITSKPTNGWKPTSQPVIKNVDGVWAFNAQGQTPGDTNKFDVFGRDIKLVSFKLYLKKWPTSPNETISVYGKGNKYAFQITNDKKLIMFMHATSGWPQEDFVPEDKEAFLNKWHNIFMVVDGKGWQRLYVDGVPSVTASGRPAQGGAIAQETTGSAKKPFSLGYNPNDNRPNWWTGMFTEEYGYVADFEFYSNKNYDNIVNGAGTDISDAQILDPTLTENINLEKLEEKYGDNVGIVLTNMLQTSNATANITVTPYVAKTNWSQETGKDTGIFEELDKKNPTAFGYSERFQSTTTLTAYDGFVFKNDAEFLKAVKDNFATVGGAEADKVEVTVEANSKNEQNKVLKIVATYGETDEAPCTCELTITPPAPVEIEIAAGQATGTGTLESTDETDIALNCLKGDHISEKKYSLEYGIKAGDEDKIDFDLDTMKVTAKKAGTAHITLTATLQTKNDSGEWVDYTNADPAGAKKVTKTIEIAVNVTRADAASAAEKTGLTTEINNAKKEYPNSVADDYEDDAWQELQDALAEAAELAKANNLDATTSQITASKARIAAAIEALAGKKSEKGKAKDALKSVLDDAALKALIDGNNADKKYTADSFSKLTAAYEAAESGLTTADAATLGTLKTALETAWKGLVEVTTGGTGTGTGTGVKDGEVLKGADGAQYQVASAKDKTVIITKGVDAKTIKVGPTVVINKETYKVIGIGNSAYAGLKKATKVIINANVVSIGDQAFAKSKKLKNVTLGADVAKIGKKAFFNCPKLNKVILKGTALNNKSIGKQAFQKTAKKVTVKWGKVKGKQRTQLKKALKKAKLKVK